MKLQYYMARLVWICVAPLVLLAAYFALRQLEQAELTQERIAANLASNVAAGIDRQLLMPIGSMLILAESPQIADRSRLEEIYHYGQTFQATFDSHLILAEATGQMLLNTRVPFGSALPKLPKVKGHSAAPTAIATGKPAVGDQLIGPVAKVPLIATAVPVRVEDKVAYLLVATVASSKFQQTLDGLALPPDWGITLRDSKGETIAYRGPDRQRRLDVRKNVTTPLSTAHWTVEVARPAGMASSGLVASAMALVLLILAVTAVALVAGLLAGRKLTRSLATLAQPVGDGADLSRAAPGAIAEVDAIRGNLAQIERCRRESEERYSTAFRTSPDAMTITRFPDGRYWDINEGFTRIFGWARDEVIGKTPSDLSIWVDAADRQRLFDALHANGECEDFETNFRTSDGRTINASISSKFMELDGQQYIMTVTRDITARKEAEERLRKLSLAVEQSEAIVVITDRESRIEYVNEAFVEQSGFSREDSIGRIPVELIGSGQTPPETYASMYRALADGEAWQGEFISRSKHGHVFVNRARVSPLRQADGTITHYVSVQEDITETRRLSAELQQHQSNLENLVAERTRQVEEMRDQLARRADTAEAANVAKTTFLANMSHEIRTPMNAILGFADLLKRSELTSEQSDRVGKLAAAGHHLLLIINNILDLSKIEAGKLVLEHVNFSLPALLEDVRSLVGETAAARGLKIEIEQAPGVMWLRGDPTRLKQALLNFAGNAVKFTERGSIKLSAEVEREEMNRYLLRFEIEDTGIGIPAERLADLFRPFQQLNAATTRKFGGTGLGLAITQRIAGLMGGEAGASSKLGSGSIFWFTAWLDRGTPLRSGENTVSMAAAELQLQLRHAGARVLLAEDNEVNQEVAIALLARAGVHVDLAANGREAVAMAKPDYALILMDIHMPEMDGLEATGQIRALPGCATIPIIAMTADAFDDDRERCTKAGMSDFVGKPVAPQKLYATVLKWLDRGQAARLASEA